jgi:hypothetical protein
MVTAVSTAACSPVEDYRVAFKHSDATAVDAGDFDGGKPAMIEAPPIRRREPGNAADGGMHMNVSRDINLHPDAAAAGSGGAPHAYDAGVERPLASSDAGKSPSAAASDEPASEPQASMSDQAGWAALLDWAGLPTFAELPTQLFSTHERGEGEMFSLVDPGNKDFNSFLASCGELPTLIDQQNDGSISCQPGETGYLIAADDGPGYVSRILLSRGVSDPSSSVLVNVRPTDERIRIYLDGAAMPVFDGTWLEWAGSRSVPFDAPLTGWTSGGTASYLPISYSSRLRVFVDKLAPSPALHYTQVDARRVKETKSFDASALASEDAHVALAALLARAQGEGDSWYDGQVTLDGNAAMTPWTRDRAGTIQRLELTLQRASATEILKQTSLRLSWDDGSPALELSLELLFGAHQVLAPLSTLPMVVNVNDAEVKLVLTLPMPFAQAAKLELVHASPDMHSLHLRVLGSDRLPRGEWGRLHASLSEAQAPMRGERLRVAALSGKGKYLGTLLYVRGKSDNSRSIPASELGFLEGDERLEIDGQVVGLGTGTDNYFNGGFYFRDGLFNSPFAAVSQLTASGSARTSEATMVRWTILSDALNFQRQFDLSFELGADRPGTVRECAAVSFYYQ